MVVAARGLRGRGSQLESSGSVVVAHGPSCSPARGIFFDWRLSLFPLHWRADPCPLHRQGSPGSCSSKPGVHASPTPCWRERNPGPGCCPLRSRPTWALRSRFLQVPPGCLFPGPDSCGRGCWAVDSLAALPGLPGTTGQLECLHPPLHKPPPLPQGQARIPV